MGACLCQNSIPALVKGSQKVGLFELSSRVGKRPSWQPTGVGSKGKRKRCPTAEQGAKEAPIAWLGSGHQWLDKWVVRVFGGKMIGAVVTKWVPENAGDTALFHVVHDDGAPACYLPICLSAYLLTSLSACLSICLPVYLSIYPPVYHSVYLSVCLSAYLSACLFP